MSLAGILTSTLNGILDKYIEAESLQNSAGQNKSLDWRNLQVRADVLQNAGLPFRIAQGLIGRLKLKLPWNLLKTAETIELLIENVFVCVVPVTKEEWNPDTIRAVEKELRRATIESLVTRLVAAALERVRHADSRQQGFLPKFITQNLTAFILARLRATIRNIHVRFESGLELDRPFTAGIAIPRASFTASQSTKNLVKDITVTLAVYFNSNDARLTAAAQSARITSPELVPKELLLLVANIQEASEVNGLPRLPPVVTSRVQVRVDPESHDLIITKDSLITDRHASAALPCSYILKPSSFSSSVSATASGFVVDVEFPPICLKLSTDLLETLLSLKTRLAQWEQHKYQSTAVPALVAALPPPPATGSRWRRAAWNIQQRRRLADPLKHWFSTPVLRLVKLHNEYLQKAADDFKLRVASKGGLRVSLTTAYNSIAKSSSPTFHLMQRATEFLRTVDEDFAVPLELVSLWRRQAAAEQALPVSDLKILGISGTVVAETMEWAELQRAAGDAVSGLKNKVTSIVNKLRHTTIEKDAGDCIMIIWCHTRYGHFFTENEAEMVADDKALNESVSPRDVTLDDLLRAAEAAALTNDGGDLKFSAKLPLLEVSISISTSSFLGASSQQKRSFLSEAGNRRQRHSVLNSKQLNFRTSHWPYSYGPPPLNFALHKVALEATHGASLGFHMQVDDFCLGLLSTKTGLLQNSHERFQKEAFFFSGNQSAERMLAALKTVLESPSEFVGYLRKKLVLLPPRDTTGPATATGLGPNRDLSPNSPRMTSIDELHEQNRQSEHLGEKATAETADEYMENSAIVLTSTGTQTSLQLRNPTVYISKACLDYMVTLLLSLPSLIDSRKARVGLLRYQKVRRPPPLSDPLGLHRPECFVETSAIAGYDLTPKQIKTKRLLTTLLSRPKKEVTMPHHDVVVTTHHVGAESYQLQVDNFTLVIRPLGSHIADSGEQTGEQRRSERRKHNTAAPDRTVTVFIPRAGVLWSVAPSFSCRSQHIKAMSHGNIFCEIPDLRALAWPQMRLFLIWRDFATPLASLMTRISTGRMQFEDLLMRTDVEDDSKVAAEVNLRNWSDDDARLLLRYCSLNTESPFPCHTLVKVIQTTLQWEVANELFKVDVNKIVTFATRTAVALLRDVLLSIVRRARHSSEDPGSIARLLLQSSYVARKVYIKKPSLAPASFSLGVPTPQQEAPESLSEIMCSNNEQESPTATSAPTPLLGPSPPFDPMQNMLYSPEKEAALLELRPRTLSLGACRHNDTLLSRRIPAVAATAATVAESENRRDTPSMVGGFLEKEPHKRLRRIEISASAVERDRARSMSKPPKREQAITAVYSSARNTLVHLMTRPKIPIPSLLFSTNRALQSVEVIVSTEMFNSAENYGKVAALGPEGPAFESPQFESPQCESPQCESPPQQVPDTVTARFETPILLLEIQWKPPLRQSALLRRRGYIPMQESFLNCILYLYTTDATDRTASPIPLAVFEPSTIPEVVSVDSFEFSSDRFLILNEFLFQEKRQPVHSPRRGRRMQVAFEEEIRGLTPERTIDGSVPTKEGESKKYLPANALIGRAGSPRRFRITLSPPKERKAALRTVARSAVDNFPVQESLKGGISRQRRVFAVEAQHCCRSMALPESPFQALDAAESRVIKSSESHHSYSALQFFFRSLKTYLGAESRASIVSRVRGVGVTLSQGGPLSLVIEHIDINQLKTRNQSKEPNWMLRPDTSFKQVFKLVDTKEEVCNFSNSPPQYSKRRRRTSVGATLSMESDDDNGLSSVYEGQKPFNHYLTVMQSKPDLVPHPLTPSYTEMLDDPSIASDISSQWLGFKGGGAAGTIVGGSNSVAEVELDLDMSPSLAPYQPTHGETTDAGLLRPLGMSPKSYYSTNLGICNNVEVSPKMSGQVTVVESPRGGHELQYWLPSKFRQFVEKRVVLGERAARRHFLVEAEIDFTGSRLLGWMRLDPIEINIGPELVDNLSLIATRLKQLVPAGIEGEKVQQEAEAVAETAATEALAFMQEVKGTDMSVDVVHNEFEISLTSVSVRLTQAYTGTEIGRITVLGVEVTTGTSHVAFTLHGIVINGCSFCPLYVAPWKLTDEVTKGTPAKETLAKEATEGVDDPFLTVSVLWNSSKRELLRGLLPASNTIGVTEYSVVAAGSRVSFRYEEVSLLLDCFRDLKVAAMALSSGSSEANRLLHESQRSGFQEKQIQPYLEQVCRMSRSLRIPINKDCLQYGAEVTDPTNITDLVTSSNAKTNRLDDALALLPSAIIIPLRRGAKSDPQKFLSCLEKYAPPEDYMPSSESPQLGSTKNYLEPIEAFTFTASSHNETGQKFMQPEIYLALRALALSIPKRPTARKLTLLRVNVALPVIFCQVPEEVTLLSLENPPRSPLVLDLGEVCVTTELFLDAELPPKPFVFSHFRARHQTTERTKDVQQVAPPLQDFVSGEDCAPDPSQRSTCCTVYFVECKNGAIYFDTQQCAAPKLLQRQCNFGKNEDFATESRRGIWGPTFLPLSTPLRVNLKIWVPFMTQATLPVTSPGSAIPVAPSFGNRSHGVGGLRAPTYVFCKVSAFNAVVHPAVWSALRVNLNTTAAVPKSRPFVTETETAPPLESRPVYESLHGRTRFDSTIGNVTNGNITGRSGLMSRSFLHREFSSETLMNAADILTDEQFDLYLKLLRTRFGLPGTIEWTRREDNTRGNAVIFQAVMEAASIALTDAEGSSLFTIELSESQAQHFTQSHIFRVWVRDFSIMESVSCPRGTPTPVVSFCNASTKQAGLPRSGPGSDENGESDERSDGSIHSDFCFVFNSAPSGPVPCNEVPPLVLSDVYLLRPQIRIHPTAVGAAVLLLFRAQDIVQNTASSVQIISDGYRSRSCDIGVKEKPAWQPVSVDWFSQPPGPFNLFNNRSARRSFGVNQNKRLPFSNSKTPPTQGSWDSPFWKHGKRRPPGPEASPRSAGTPRSTERLGDDLNNYSQGEINNNSYVEVTENLKHADEMAQKYFQKVHKNLYAGILTDRSPETPAEPDLRVRNHAASDSETASTAAPLSGAISTADSAGGEGIANLFEFPVNRSCGPWEVLEAMGALDFLLTWADLDHAVKEADNTAPGPSLRVSRSEQQIVLRSEGATIMFCGIGDRERERNSLTALKPLQTSASQTYTIGISLTGSFERKRYVFCVEDDGEKACCSVDVTNRLSIVCSLNGLKRGIGYPLQERSCVLSAASVDSNLVIAPVTAALNYQWNHPCLCQLLRELASTAKGVPPFNFNSEVGFSDTFPGDGRKHRRDDLSMSSRLPRPPRSKNAHDTFWTDFIRPKPAVLEPETSEFIPSPEFQAASSPLEPPNSNNTFKMPNAIIRTLSRPTGTAAHSIAARTTSAATALEKAEGVYSINVLQRLRRIRWDSPSYRKQICTDFGRRLRVNMEEITMTVIPSDLFYCYTFLDWLSLDAKVESGGSHYEGNDDNSGGDLPRVCRYSAAFPIDGFKSAEESYKDLKRSAAADAEPTRASKVANAKEFDDYINAKIVLSGVKAKLLAYEGCLVLPLCESATDPGAVLKNRATDFLTVDIVPSKIIGYAELMAVKDDLERGDNGSVDNASAARTAATDEQGTSNVELSQRWRASTGVNVALFHPRANHTETILKMAKIHFDSRRARTQSRWVLCPRNRIEVLLTVDHLIRFVRVMRQFQATAIGAFKEWRWYRQQFWTARRGSWLLGVAPQMHGGLLHKSDSEKTAMKLAGARSGSAGRGKRMRLRDLRPVKNLPTKSISASTATPAPSLSSRGGIDVPPLIVDLRCLQCRDDMGQLASVKVCAPQNLGLLPTEFVIRNLSPLYLYLYFPSTSTPKRSPSSSRFFVVPPNYTVTAEAGLLESLNVVNPGSSYRIQLILCRKPASLDDVRFLPELLDLNALPAPTERDRTSFLGDIAAEIHDLVRRFFPRNCLSAVLPQVILKEVQGPQHIRLIHSKKQHRWNNNVPCTLLFHSEEVQPLCLIPDSESPASDNRKTVLFSLMSDVRLKACYPLPLVLRKEDSTKRHPYLLLPRRSQSWFGSNHPTRINLSIAGQEATSLTKKQSRRHPLPLWKSDIFARSGISNASLAKSEASRAAVLELFSSGESSLRLITFESLNGQRDNHAIITAHRTIHTATNPVIAEPLNPLGPVSQAGAIAAHPAMSPASFSSVTYTIKAPLYVFNCLPIQIRVRLFDRNTQVALPASKKDVGPDPVDIQLPPVTGRTITTIRAIEGLALSLAMPVRDNIEWSSPMAVWLGGSVADVDAKHKVIVEQRSVRVFIGPARETAYFNVLTTFCSEAPPPYWDGVCAVLSITILPSKMLVSRLPTPLALWEDRSVFGDGSETPFFFNADTIRLGIPKTPARRQLHSTRLWHSVSTLSAESIEQQRKGDDQNVGLYNEYGGKPTLSQRLELDRIFCCVPSDDRADLIERLDTDSSDCVAPPTGFSEKRPTEDSGPSSAYGKFCCKEVTRQQMDKRTADTSSEYSPDVSELIDASLIADQHWITGKAGSSVSRYRYCCLGERNVILRRIDAAKDYTAAPGVAQLRSNHPIPLPTLTQVSALLRGLPPTGFLPFVSRKQAQITEAHTDVQLKSLVVVANTLQNATDSCRYVISADSHENLWFAALQENFPWSDIAENSKLCRQKPTLPRLGLSLFEVIPRFFISNYCSVPVEFRQCTELGSATLEISSADSRNSQTLFPGMSYITNFRLSPNKLVYAQVRRAVEAGGETSFPSKNVEHRENAVHREGIYRRYYAWSAPLLLAAESGDGSFERSQKRKFESGVVANDATFWSVVLAAVPLRSVDPNNHAIRTTDAVKVEIKTDHATGVTRILLKPAHTYPVRVNNHSRLSTLCLRQPLFPETTQIIPPESSKLLHLVVPPSTVFQRIIDRPTGSIVPFHESDGTDDTLIAGSKSPSVIWERKSVTELDIKLPARSHCCDSKKLSKRFRTDATLLRSLDPLLDGNEFSPFVMEVSLSLSASAAIPGLPWRGINLLRCQQSCIVARVRERGFSKTAVIFHTIEDGAGLVFSMYESHVYTANQFAESLEAGTLTAAIPPLPAVTTKAELRLPDLRASFCGFDRELLTLRGNEIKLRTEVTTRDHSSNWSDRLKVQVNLERLVLYHHRLAFIHNRAPSVGQSTRIRWTPEAMRQTVAQNLHQDQCQDLYQDVRQQDRRIFRRGKFLVLSPYALFSFGNTDLGDIDLTNAESAGDTTNEIMVLEAQAFRRIPNTVCLPQFCEYLLNVQKLAFNFPKIGLEIDADSFLKDFVSLPRQILGETPLQTLSRWPPPTYEIPIVPPEKIIPSVNASAKSLLRSPDMVRIQSVHIAKCSISPLRVDCFGLSEHMLRIMKARQLPLYKVIGRQVESRLSILGAEISVPEISISAVEMPFVVSASHGLEVPVNVRRNLLYKGISVGIQILAASEIGRNFGGITVEEGRSTFLLLKDNVRRGQTGRLLQAMLLRALERTAIRLNRRCNVYLKNVANLVLDENVAEAVNATLAAESPANVSAASNLLDVWDSLVKIVSGSRRYDAGLPQRFCARVVAFAALLFLLPLQCVATAAGLLTQQARKKTPIERPSIPTRMVDVSTSALVTADRTTLPSEYDIRDEAAFALRTLAWEEHLVPRDTSLHDAGVNSLVSNEVITALSEQSVPRLRSVIKNSKHVCVLATHRLIFLHRRSSKASFNICLGQLLSCTIEFPDSVPGEVLNLENISTASSSARADFSAFLAFCRCDECVTISSLKQCGSSDLFKGALQKDLFENTETSQASSNGTDAESACVDRGISNINGLQLVDRHATMSFQWVAISEGSFERQSAAMKNLDLQNAVAFFLTLNAAKYDSCGLVQ